MCKNHVGRRELLSLTAGSLITLAVPSSAAEQVVLPAPNGQRGQIAAAIKHITQANETFVNTHRPGYFSALIKG